MVFLEVILELVFIDLVKLTGVFVRWTFVVAVQLANGNQVTSLANYQRKLMRRVRDPSNSMSDGIINWFLGFGTLLVAVSLLDAVL